MKLKEIIPKFSLFALILLLLNIVTILIGGTNSKLTVINKTDKYLHINVDGKMYSYVAPEYNITHEAGGVVTSMRTRVFYSPGQSMGDAEIDTTLSIPYTPAQTTGSKEGCDCADDTYDCESVTSSTTPAEGGSATWEVTAQQFD